MSRRSKTLPHFFLDVYETDDYMETDNEAVAFERFYACQFSCILWKDGKILAEKEFVEVEEADSALILHAEIASDGEYADLEEVEVV